MLRTQIVILRSWLQSLGTLTRRSPRLRLTTLEDRTVPDATALYDPTSKILTITGDAVAVDDDLAIELVHRKVQVFQNAGTTHDLLTIAGAPAQGLKPSALSRIVVNAGDGNDTVFVTATIRIPTELHGGTGDDALTGGRGDDQIFGDDGVDTLDGGAGNDVINGGNGDGVLAGDVIIGGDGNDSVTGGPQNDAIFGGPGDDTVNAGAGDDQIRGDDPAAKKGGNDVIDGEAGDDVLIGGKGNDLLNGGNGNDTAEGGDGSDTITGGGDLDVTFTGPDDANAGAADADLLYGGNDNDSIVGGWGNDLIFGESGNDILKGGVGQDVLSGGLGQDVFIGHGVTGGNSGTDTDEGNFDTYKDEFDLTRPVFGKSASVKSVAPTELGIQAALAGFAAIANNQVNFNIGSRIRYLGSGDYLVKFGSSDESNPDPANPNPFEWVPVHFDGTWTDNDPRPNALERFPKAKDSREFWTILLHRAVVETFTGNYDPFAYYDQASYEALDSRLTNPSAIVEELTGSTASNFALSSNPPAGYTLADIKNNLALGSWLTATVKAAPALAGLAAGQAYAITKVTTTRAGNFITLYNPSGFDKGTTNLGTLDVGKPADDGYITLSEADFFANFEIGYLN